MNKKKESQVSTGEKVALESEFGSRCPFSTNQRL